MLVKIAKETAVNPKQVIFVGTVDQLNEEAVKEHIVVVFILGMSKGLNSEYDFDTTIKMLNEGE